MADDNGSFKREPAVRMFAAELLRSDLQLEKASEDQFAPAYVLTPTGAKVNRVFHVGTLVEIEDMGDETNSVLRARIVDPTGAVFVRAGQYQPEAAVILNQMRSKLPCFVAVTGKPNVYKPDEDTTYVSIRPEHVNIVTEKERNCWIAETIQATLDRIAKLKEAKGSQNPDLMLNMALEHYGFDTENLKELVRQAISITTGNSGNGSGSEKKEEQPKQPEEKAPAGQQTSSQPPAEFVPASSPPQTSPPQAPAQTSSPATEPAKKKSKSKSKGKEPAKEQAQTEQAAKQTENKPEAITDKTAQAYEILKKNAEADGTMGANAFIDRVTRDLKVAPEEVMKIIKHLFDQGMAYEPKVGRVKAV